MFLSGLYNQTYLYLGHKTGDGFVSLLKVKVPKHIILKERKLNISL